MMEIYEYVREMRIKRGATMKQLYMGICSESTGKAFETGRRNLDVFKLFRVLERLETSEGHLQFLLKRDDYELWEKRMEIMDEIRQMHYDKAMELIACWERSLNTKQRMEKQFIHRMKSFCMIHKEYSPDDIQKEISRAIQITAPDFEENWENYLLSIHELDMLLDYYRYSDCNQEVIIRKIVEYMQKKVAICDKKNVLYAKAAVLFFESAIKIKPIDQWTEDRIMEMNNVLGKGLEVLRLLGCSFYMPEILDCRSVLIAEMVKRKMASRDAEVENEQWLAAIKSTYDVLGFSIDTHEILPLYCLTGVELFQSVLERRRKLLQMTERELAYTKCDPRTVKRIEQAGLNPQDATMEMFLEELRLPKTWGKGFFLFYNVQKRKKMVQLSRYFASGEFDKVLQLTEKVQDLLDDNDIYSQQNLEWYRLEALYLLERIKAKPEVSKLKENLERSVSWDTIMEYGMDYLTLNEVEHVITILLRMSITDVDFERLLYIVEDYFNNHLGDFKWINYASLISVLLNTIQAKLAEIKQFEKANQICRQMLPTLIFHGDLKRMMNVVYDMWWNTDKKNDKQEENPPTYLIHLAQLINDTSSVDFFTHKFGI